MGVEFQIKERLRTVGYAAIFRGRLAQNVFMNYLSVLWLGGMTLLLIPRYTQLLGAQQWGIVAVSISLQGFMTLLDAGLAQIMPRDIAKTSENPEVVSRIFHVFARAYLILAFTGFVIGQLAAPWFGQYWLKATPETVSDATIALRLVLLQFLFQFTNNAHIGYWNGVQAQVTANIRQCVFATAKHAGAIALIVWWKHAAIAYLLSFAFFSAIEYLSNRHAVVRSLHNAGQSTIVTKEELVSLARETGVLAAGVVLGMLVSQVDRIILSGNVSLAAFGRYVVVANLGLAFLQLQYPLVRAFQPRLVTAQTDVSSKAYWQLGFSILLLCILPCVVVGVLTPLILHLWIGDPVTVEQGTLPLRLILASVALNGLYQIIYQQMIIKGSAGMIFKINFLVIIIIVPLAMLAVRWYGIAGGGIVWLSVSILQILLGFTSVKMSRK
jgi:O-antigen/teichoic acid export membrane protein